MTGPFPRPWIPVLALLLVGCGPPVADDATLQATRNALAAWAAEAHAERARTGAWPAPPDAPLQGLGRGEESLGVDVRILRADPSPGGGIALAFRADPVPAPRPGAATGDPPAEPRGEPRVRGVLQLAPPPSPAFVLHWSSGRWLRGRSGEIVLQELGAASRHPPLASPAPNPS